MQQVTGRKPVGSIGSAQWRREGISENLQATDFRDSFPGTTQHGTTQHQVEIGTFDELLGLNSELIHELTRFANSLFGGLVVHQHDFELEKMAETFDAVQVNAGTSNQVESAVFADATDLSVGQRKRFTKRLRRRSG